MYGVLFAANSIGGMSHGKRLEWAYLESAIYEIADGISVTHYGTFYYSHCETLVLHLNLAGSPTGSWMVLSRSQLQIGSATHQVVAENYQSSNESPRYRWHVIYICVFLFLFLEVLCIISMSWNETQKYAPLRTSCL